MPGTMTVPKPNKRRPSDQEISPFSGRDKNANRYSQHHALRFISGKAGAGLGGGTQAA